MPHFVGVLDSLADPNAGGVDAWRQGLAVSQQQYLDDYLRHLAQQQQDQQRAYEEFAKQQAFDQQRQLQADKVGQEDWLRQGQDASRMAMARFEAGNQANRDFRMADIQADQSAQGFGQQNFLQQQQLQAHAQESAAARRQQKEMADFEAQQQQSRMRAEIGNQVDRDVFEAQQKSGDYAQLQQFKMQEMAAQQELHAQAQYEAQIAHGLQTGKLKYTPAQQQRMGKLQDALWKVQDDSRLDQDQKQQAAQEIQRQIRSIAPMAVPPDQQPVPLERDFAQNTYEHPVYGLLTKNKNGEWTAVRGVRNPKAADSSKSGAEDLARKKAAANYAASLMKMTKLKMVRGEEVREPIYTPDQAWSEANARFGINDVARESDVGGARRYMDGSMKFEGGYVPGTVAGQPITPQTPAQQQPGQGFDPSTRMVPDTHRGLPLPGGQPAGEQVPPEVAAAASVLQQFRQQYGDKIPAEKATTFQAALEIYKQYHQGKQ